MLAITRIRETQLMGKRVTLRAREPGRALRDEDKTKTEQDLGPEALQNAAGRRPRGRPSHSVPKDMHKGTQGPLGTLSHLGRPTAEQINMHVWREMCKEHTCLIIK